MNRRTFIQGVLALAAMGPLGRKGLAVEAATDHSFKTGSLYWEPNLERACQVSIQPGPTKIRALVLFGKWGDPA